MFQQRLRVRTIILRGSRVLAGDCLPNDRLHQRLHHAHRLYRAVLPEFEQRPSRAERPTSGDDILRLLERVSENVRAACSRPEARRGIRAKQIFCRGVERAPRYDLLYVS